MWASLSAQNCADLSESSAVAKKIQSRAARRLGWGEANTQRREVAFRARIEAVMVAGLAVESLV